MPAVTGGLTEIEKERGRQDQCFMQRPVHPSYGRAKQNVVLICVDGSGRVNFFFFFLNSYVSQSPVGRTAQSTLQSALHVMLLSYYIGIYVYFMSVNATLAVAAHTRKVSRRPSTCPTTGNILILHKTLGRREGGREIKRE